MSWFSLVYHWLSVLQERYRFSCKTLQPPFESEMDASRSRSNVNQSAVKVVNLTFVPVRLRGVEGPRSCTSPRVLEGVVLHTC